MIKNINPEVIKYKIYNKFINLDILMYKIGYTK